MDPLKDFTITPGLLKAIAAIDEFKGRWEAFGHLAPERLSILRRIATIESIGSSTRIEGVRLRDDEIEKILAGIEIRSFRTRDKQEVAGYAALMEIIFESFPDISITENHICQLHQNLLKFSDKDQHHRGHYKTVPNHVEAFNESGRSIGVIFETATPFDTPGLMGDLLDWTRTSLEKGEHHVLLVIAVFVVRFLAIHPFQDGNGRLSRALTTLLLLRAGYQYVIYSSFERIIEDNKDQYYMALRKAQTTLDADESQLSEWINFFIECLVRQKDILIRKIERERLMVPLAPLSEKILGIVQEHGRATVREASAITNTSRNTIKDHIKQLVQAGHLARRGRGRGTWYEKP